MNKSLGKAESIMIHKKELENRLTHWEKVHQMRWGSYMAEIERGAILRAHSFFNEPTTALEIGCEGGRWVRLLAELGWNMICTEVNPNLLEICKKRIPSAKHILVGPKDTKIPCNTQSIKLLLCIEVFPVISSHWFLDEALRTLQHGGLIVGTKANSLSVRGVYYRMMCKITPKKDYGYYSSTQSYYKFRRKIIHMGFQLIFEEGLCWMPFSRKSDSILVPALTKLEKLLGLRRLTGLSPVIVFIARKI